MARPISVKCTLHEYGNVLRELERDRVIRLRRALRLGAEDAVEILANATPVKTGQARDGWKVENRRLGPIVVNRVPYIFFLEYGTRNMAPRFILRGSLPLLRVALEDRLADAL